jgi:hypothetical protein
MRVLNSHLVSSNPADLGGSLAVPFQAGPVVIASGTLSGSFSTPGLNVLHLYGFSVQVTVAGSLSGSVALYASNEAGNDRLPPAWNQQVAGAAPTALSQGISNWVQVAGSQQSLSCSTGSPSSVVYNLSQQFYKWLQVQYVHSAGTGSIDVWVTGKGDAD